MQEKLRQQTPISLISVSNLPVAFISGDYSTIFCCFQIDSAPTAAFLLPAATGNLQSPSGRLSVLHSSPFSPVPL